MWMKSFKVAHEIAILHICLGDIMMYPLGETLAISLLDLLFWEICPLRERKRERQTDRQTDRQADYLCICVMPFMSKSS